MLSSMAACGSYNTPATTTAAAAAETKAAAETTAAAAESKAEEAAPAADATTIILGHFGAPGEPVTNAAETFKSELEKVSGGAMTVEIHPNSELGNAKEMAEQTAINAIQACLISQGSLDKYDIRYALPIAPYVFTSYEQAYAVCDGPFAEWVNDGTLESKGLHNVGPWDYGFRCLTNSKKEVKAPEDVKGLKIRTPNEVQKVACFEALGADVQQIAFSELITALKQGTVDGQENPLSTIYNNKMWEANQKYLTLDKHTWEAVNLTVSNEFWEGLNDEQKGWIEDAADVAKKQMREEVQNGEADYIQKLKDAGKICYSVGYNIDMLETAPTAALTSATNVWEVYYEYLFKSMMDGENPATNWSEGYNEGAVAITDLGPEVADGTAEKVAEVEAALKDGSLHVFDTSKFTVDGAEVTTAPIDLTYYDFSTGSPVAVYQGETKEAISDGYFHEGELRAAPTFALRIDGIIEDADPVA